MLSRSAFRRQAQRAARSLPTQPARGLAAPASGSFAYETGTANGVKLASRDMAGPTTKLAIVSRAGTRYEPLPGLTLGLQSFAFKVCANQHHRLSSYNVLISNNRPPRDAPVFVSSARLS